MRSLSLILVISMLLNAASCKKNNDTSGTPTLQGSWKLVLMTGGIGGVHITAANWGHTRSYTFLADGAYTTTQDAKTSGGTYTTGKDILKGANTEINVVTLDGSEKFEYSFAHDTLILNRYDISDIMYDWYVRQ